MLLASSTATIEASDSVYWSLEEARSLIEHYHVDTNAHELNDSQSTLIEKLEAIDQYFSIDTTPHTDTKSGIGKYGVYLIESTEKTVLVPLRGGAAHAAGISQPVALLDNTDFAKGLIVGQYLDNGGQVHEVLEHGDWFVRSAELTNVDGIDVVSIYGFVAGETNNTLLRLLKFSHDQDLQQTQSENIPTQPRRNILLDLRYCAGGDIFEAADSASLWFDNASPWISIEARNHEVVDLVSGSREPHDPPAPTIALISKLTASSCEQFVQGLSTNGKIKLLGERTAGKCSVQSTYDLGTESSIRFTTGKWFGPLSKPCSIDGVEPHHSITGNIHSFEDIMGDSNIMLYLSSTPNTKK